MKLKKIVSLLSVLGIALACSFPAAVVSGEASVDTRYNHSFAEQFLAEYAPAAHGGLYFDENGTLVVNVLPDAACNSKIVETVTKQMPIKAGAHVYRSTDSRRRVEIKTVTHSYQELLDAFHILSDNMIRLGIQSVAIREAENVVLVTPEPGGHASLQKEIDTLVDSDVVKIEYPIAQNSASEPEMKHVFTKDIDVKPGTEVTGGYSIGYAAGWDGKLGYTVPGHAVLVGGTVKYNGETLGTVRYRALGGPLDIAFVEKEDKNGFLGIGALKFKGSNVTPEGEFVGSMGRAVISGERVHFRGYRSQKQIGNIINASFAAVVDGIQMTDCAQANYVAIGGDSGGCVYYYDDYPYEPRQLSKVLGTQSFSLLQNGNWVDDSYSVFSKKSNQTQIEVLSW